MLDKDLIKKLDMKDPAIWLATWFGCGLIKGAPGTWGTIGALPFAWLLFTYCGWSALLAATIMVMVVGYWAAGKFEKSSGTHDHGAIVIDEVAGMFFTLLVLREMTIPYLITGFFLFRVCDITKPWPVSYFDKKPGAYGVMMDDIAAGLFAALYLIVIQTGVIHAGLG